MSSANREHFPSSFLIGYPLYIFLGIALARTSSTIFSESGENRDLSLVPDLGGSLFTSKHYVSCGFVSIWSSLCLGTFPLGSVVNFY